jgi:hypothetical protein
LINQAAGAEVVTVSATNGGAEADLEADAVDDMADAELGMADAAVDTAIGDETEEEEVISFSCSIK